MPALVENVVDEIVVMSVPDPWAALPPDTQIEIGYWYLVDTIRNGSRGVLPLGPPSNLDWVITSDPVEVEQVVIRHECDQCRDAKARAVDALKSGQMTKVAIVQFRQKYLTDVRALSQPYQTTELRTATHTSDSEQDQPQQAQDDADADSQRDHVEEPEESNNDQRSADPGEKGHS